jgi:hypothetical protein
MSRTEATMKRYPVLLAVPAIALAACAGFGTETGHPNALRQAETTITAADLQAWISFLASDELRGRDTPSPGLEAAAEWIAGEFQRFGLEPAGEDGWMQRYPFPLEGLDARQARVEISGGTTHALEYGVDFFAQPGTTPTHAVGVVFLTALDELDRGPVGGLRDRAVLVPLPGTPESARGGFRYGATDRARIGQARAHARDAGAAAIVFIMDERVGPDGVRALAETAGAPERRLGGRAAAGEEAAFFVSRTAALRMFRMAGVDGAEQLRRYQSVRPVPLPGITLRLDAPFLALDQAEPPNVVGLARGSDPALRDTYIVLSAHMDHVGVGRPDATGDSIYNGADDNATGTAALVAVARAIAALPEAPARSILFLAVSGEEKGLLGSRWFVDNPTIPLEAVVANLNLDMIGRNAPDTIVVIGKEYSSLGPLVRGIAEDRPDLGLAVAPDPWPDQRFFFRSDHFSFAAREIPALFFFAGTHDDYHRPSDTADRIDFDKTARVARLAFLTAMEIAQSPDAPTWDAEGLEEVRRMTRRP